MVRFRKSGSGFGFTRLGMMLVAAALVLSACSGASAAPGSGPGSGFGKTATAITTAVPSPTTLPKVTPTSLPATPTATTSAAVSPSLLQVSMWDGDHGWGLSQNAVFYTRDGGLSWVDVTPRNGWLAEGIAKGFFLDSTTAWVIQPVTQDFQSSTLYHTTDGGQTWEATPVPFGPDSLQFLNAQEGWVMADRGAAAGSMAVDVYQTKDGGTSWVKVYGVGLNTPNTPGELPFGGDKTGMAFRDLQNGWIGGTQPILGHSYLYRTTDGGKTWAEQVLSIPADYASSEVMTYAPVFFKGQEGVLPVDLDTQTRNLDFYHTRDGGQSWQSTSVVQNVDAYDIASFQDIWAWSGKTLEASQDGGQSWDSITPQIDLQGKIQALDFIDAKDGWAISMDSQGKQYLYRTEDGGKKWVEESGKG